MKIYFLILFQIEEKNNLESDNVIYLNKELKKRFFIKSRKRAVMRRARQIVLI